MNKESHLYLVGICFLMVFMLYQSFRIRDQSLEIARLKSAISAWKQAYEFTRPWPQENE